MGRRWDRKKGQVSCTHTSADPQCMQRAGAEEPERTATSREAVSLRGVMTVLRTLPSQVAVGSPCIVGVRRGERGRF